MRLQFNYKFGDFLSANLLHFRRSPGTKLYSLVFLPIGILLCLIIILSPSGAGLQGQDARDVSGIAIGGPVLLLLLAPLLIAAVSALSWKRRPELKQDV